jgi:hypothetical protein
MTRFANGLYTPKNPQKYIGKRPPRYRSSWEMTFMIFLDNNNNVLHWASEAITVPYRHPFTGKTTNYIPDFFVVYVNKYGKQLAEIVEIKPKKQSLIENAKASANDRAIVAINQAKWKSAAAFCKQHGYSFRVLNENDLFHKGSTR